MVDRPLAGLEPGGADTQERSGEPARDAAAHRERIALALRVQGAEPEAAPATRWSGDAASLVLMRAFIQISSYTGLREQIQIYHLFWTVGPEDAHAVSDG